MFWPILALLYLPICLVAAKKSPQEQLVDLAAAGNGVIRLDEHSFDLLTTPQRNWTAAIHFTAMNKRMKCTPCKEFDPSWVEVAKAWTTVPKAERDNHFFGTLDFDDASVVFQKLSLASAPVVQVYPATEGPRSTGRTIPYKYDFSHGFGAEPLANQLSNHTPVPIPYKVPIDWARWGSVAALIPIITLLFRFISPALKSRWVWAAGTIVISLVMTSGYMFTRIRGSPYAGPNGEWIAQGYSNQFGQEVQVVAMIYGVAGAAVLMLTIVTPYQMSPPRQRMQIYLWTAVNLIMFSILVSLFRVKNRGYPFKLLF
ncbi:hypothetical protein SERLA73DRAFT_185405 [Serpula lacrymans var. lacrymans S7.3]|uniref:Oligosaccharyl transferase subunit OST3/OST6 family n=2 Tax=Serpula lacrymans var. lacrymans TaxID=341189 RepID=F8Q5R7_SERL3|nr:uncharacterized protein SERLADRAFT_473881 [Serpula lacrymans var. lacrymans S7.9]EGN95955.1 hypothetical protein SERLA73DRAFT_185405 [Serpula lacrymans var. lacrymans S7.3]EGO21478.1 hypothetical protein SERLADRAFT_473881 [Serpula lacrymans var. lacrymans S7.9]